MNPEIVDVVNDDGTVTRTITRTNIQMMVLTPDQIQKEQTAIQAQIDSLTSKLTASQGISTTIQSKLAAKSQLGAATPLPQ
jgi:hypothetical protein